jgi:putative addiction module component (TIGR02574 family)
MKDTQEDLNIDEGREVEAAWAAEIENRIADVERGEAKSATWEEARRRIRATLAKL